MARLSHANCCLNIDDDSFTSDNNFVNFGTRDLSVSLQGVYGWT